MKAATERMGRKEDPPSCALRFFAAIPYE